MPIERNRGAITQALSPNINFIERSSCTLFPARAPKRLIPIKEIYSGGIFPEIIIIRALEKDPATEKRNT